MSVWAQQNAGTDTGGGASSVSRALVSATPSGDLLVVAVTEYNSSGFGSETITVTDNSPGGSNTYIQRQRVSGGAKSRVTVYTAIAQATATLAVTASVTAGEFLAINVYDCSCANGTPAYDTGNTANGTGTSASSSSLTPASGATDIALAFGTFTGGSSTFTAGSGFTAGSFTDGNAAPIFGEYALDQVSAITPAFSTSLSVSWGLAAILLKRLVNLALSGPTSGTAGTGYSYTITPAAATTDTVTFSDGGHGGTFSPATLSFTNSSTPQSVTYSNPSSGTYPISATSSIGAVVSGTPVNLTLTGGAAPAGQPAWFKRLGKVA